MKHWLAIAGAAIAVFAIVSLVTGASYLETLLPGGLPLGNALVAIALCAAAGSALEFSPPGTVLRRLSVVSLVGAAAWLPVSIALAGNLFLNFNGGNFLAWLVFSLLIVAVVLCAWCWALVASWLGRYRRAGATK